MYATLVREDFHADSAFIGPDFSKSNKVSLVFATSQEALVVTVFKRLNFVAVFANKFFVSEVKYSSVNAQDFSCRSRICRSLKDFVTIKLQVMTFRTTLSVQIEVSMISKIDWSGFVSCRAVFPDKLVFVVELVDYAQIDISRKALLAVRTFSGEFYALAF